MSEPMAHTATASPTVPSTQDLPLQIRLGSVSAELERSLTQVARAILRLEVPTGALAEGESIDRAGYWLLVRVSMEEPIRQAELAESVELDPSTVSRQIRNLVGCGLVDKAPDPQDGRAALLRLSDRGRAVLEAVSEARRQALAEATSGWTDEQRTALASGVLRLEAGLHHHREAASPVSASAAGSASAGDSASVGGTL